MNTKRTMRRTLLMSLALAAATLLTLSPTLVAQEAAKAVDAKEGALPLNRVIMFNSGVGYFEHSGNIDGDTQVELQFRVDDINDLLKSMILEDRGGGTISTVTYGSKDPITKTLRTFPIDLTDNPTLGQILDQVRGERVSVDAPNAIEGLLLGVETRRKEVGPDKDVVEQEFLNLLTDQGLRSVPMDSISRIKLSNEKLDAELRQALAVLATGHNTDKKTVTLNLLGSGTRPVRVGYVQQTPVWKTSYRLVLSDKEPPFLQGWAVVENTTETDWNDVTLSLVSGRPISFRMDLYDPLYVQRPEEQLNLFASLGAQRYGQDLAKPADEKLAVPEQQRRAGVGIAQRGRGAGGMGGMMGGMAPAAAPMSEASDSAAIPFEQNSFALNQPSAQAGDVGELFQYTIKTPVTLARQKSAMLPIVNETVEGEKISIYNASVQTKHPLNGLRLTNSTDLHLMQGPITVFDGGSYAGDAMIDGIEPGAERLISYALDLTTEVAPESKGHPEELVDVKIAKGVMQVSRKLTREQIYTVKNSDDKTKTVLIEQRFDPNWKLVSPKEPTEKTRDRYRFAVEAKPDEPTKLSVEEERLVSQEFALSNINQGMIVFYSKRKEVSPKVKAALQEAIKRKQAWQEVAQQRMQLEKQTALITQEQNRIRQNMAQLDRNTDLYRRYVEKFGQQEDEVEKLRKQIEELTTRETEMRKSLDDYLLNLTVS